MSYFTPTLLVMFIRLLIWPDGGRMVCRPSPGWQAHDIRVQPVCWLEMK
jgi:hypothetical protein